MTEPLVEQRYVIRPASPDDVAALIGLIYELAVFEKAEEFATMSEEQLSAALFGATPSVFTHVAERDGEVVAMAVWFVTFSTWTGRHGIFLEDLYVRPEHRRQGLGLKLLSTLAQIATDCGYARIDWRVLDWNEPARTFYRSLGAIELEEWETCRLEGSAIGDVARR